jgi:hypothetical protein
MLQVITRKEFKYNNKKSKLSKLFESPTKENYIILSQLNSIKGAKLDQLKKYGKEKHIDVEYLQYKKMKNIFKNNQAIVERMNNEMLIIKGSNYAKEIKEFLLFLKQEGLEEKVLILTLLIENNTGYRELSLEEYKKKNIVVETKEEALIDFYKMLKLKVMGIQIKLIKIINDHNKSNKE